MKELGGLSWENQFFCLIGPRVSPQLLTSLTLSHTIPNRPVECGLTLPVYITFTASDLGTKVTTYGSDVKDTKEAESFLAHIDPARCSFTSRTLLLRLPRVGGEDHLDFSLSSTGLPVL